MPPVEEKVKSLVNALNELFPLVKGPEDRDPFRVLVRTVLSQNTSYKNEREAYLRLKREIGLTPQALASAEEERIAECIRVAGLHRVRARRIKKLARLVLERYGGDLSGVLRRDVREARRELMSLPGVGMKTADILLLFCAGKPVMPVDTHISRISRRLGLVREKAGYEEIREVYERFLPPGSHERVHLQLIMFGRAICRARKPRCHVCPLAGICDYRGKIS